MSASPENGSLIPSFLQVSSSRHSHTFQVGIPDDPQPSPIILCSNGEDARATYHNTDHLNQSVLHSEKAAAESYGRSTSQQTQLPIEENIN